MVRQTNPIVAELIHHAGQPKKIAKIEVENRLGPNAIVFYFDDGTNERFETNPKDHAEFMEWWKNAAAYFHLTVN